MKRNPTILASLCACFAFALLATPALADLPAWTGGKVDWRKASAYEQAGLLAHWDGIDNAGTGTHVSSTNTWKNLAPSDTNGTYNLTVNSYRTWGDSWLNVSGPSAMNANSLGNYGTIEILYRSASVSSSSVMFNGGNRNHWCAHTSPTDAGGYKMFFYSAGTTSRIALYEESLNTNLDWFVTVKYGSASSSSVAASIYTNGLETTASSYKCSTTWNTGSGYVVLGDRTWSAKKSTTSKPWYGRIYAIRLYSSLLTPAQIANNALLDQARYHNDAAAIAEIEAKRFTVDEIAAQPITGASCEPQVVVRDLYDTNIVLTCGKDYTVEYTNNTEPGTGTATVTGIGDYGVARVRTQSVTFTIIDQRPRFTVDTIPAHYLVDASCQPTVVVRDAETGAVLTLGKDYTVSYTNNTAGGTATATVTGIGDYGFASDKEKSSNFTIVDVWRVRADATGTGRAWADAMNWTNALLTAKTSAVPCEIWVAGDVTATNGTEYAFAKLLAIRGGYAGTEKDPSERPAGRSVVDGLNTYNCLDFSNTGALTLDSLYFTRGFHHGVRKTASAGNLTVTNCAFNGNGAAGGTWSYKTWSQGTNPALNAIGGGGANFIGKSTAKLAVVDCEFSGNTTKPGCNNFYAGWGGGACIANFTQTTIDRCSFVTNHPGLGKNYRMGYSSALQLYATPTRVSGCVFRGNAAPMPDGSVVNVYGSGCKGTVFENCLFTGNINGKYYTSVLTGKGEICFDMGSSNVVAAVTNCTFAYNYARRSATITVNAGKVDVHNSILWANVSESATPRGTEIHCYSNGVVNADWILIGGTSTNYVSSLVEGAVTLGDHVFTYDPKLVTPTKTFTDLMEVTEMPYTGWTATQLNKLEYDPARAAYNVHLRGTYVDETTGQQTHIGTSSPAVDTGDPAMDYANEPEPNGKRINFGCYGNTPWATCTPKGFLYLCL